MIANAEYKALIGDAVFAAYGYRPTVEISGEDVTVTCDTGGAGITFSQIMALREVFGAEFNIDTEHHDGDTSDAGTWFPGEDYIIFTYRRPNVPI